MTDRERRLLDAAKVAARVLRDVAEDIPDPFFSRAINAAQTIERSLQEYFGSERQDT